MARTTWQELTYSGIIDPAAITPPIAWQKAECALIRLEVESRDPIVGKADYSKIIAREWSGYWYLYRDGYQLNSGSIDFKSEQIYFDRWFWTAEITTQQLAQRVPLIEATQPEENVEELSEFLLLGGEILAQLLSNIPLPITGGIIEFIANFFADLSSEDLNYLPSPYRPDRLYVWFPVGKVSLKISFHWLGYSPLALGAGIGEIPIEDLQQLPQLPQAIDSPENPIPQLSFEELAIANGFIPEARLDEFARAAGYIKGDECAVLKPKPGWRLIAFQPNGAPAFYKQFKAYECEALRMRLDYPRGDCPAPNVYAVWSDTRGRWATPALNCNQAFFGIYLGGFSQDGWGFEEIPVDVPAVSPC